MEYYPIQFNFRGQRINAHVHKHEDSYLVFFSDNMILKDFGGKVTFDKSKKAIEYRKNIAADSNEFFNSVAAQLV